MTPGRRHPSPARARGSGMPAPLVIAHRGASGYRPEHTLAAYELAVAMGADYLEPDLVMTRDDVLVVRHEPEISETTDVARRPEFADRRATKMLDGVAVTGWFAEDFTLAELRTLRAIERLPDLRRENTIHDGQWPVPTLEEVLALRARLTRTTGRQIGVIPEIKHSTYFREMGKDPEAALMRLVTAWTLNRPDAPLWVQSFELTNLLDLRDIHGYQANLVFLAADAGAPYDLVAAGDPRTYDDLMQEGALATLAEAVDGIGPDRGLVIARDEDGALGESTGLVARAHATGLKVIPWTYRAENAFLPRDYRIGDDPAAYGRIIDEVKLHIAEGVDGLFCDQPDIGVKARRQVAEGE